MQLCIFPVDTTASTRNSNVRISSVRKQTPEPSSAKFISTFVLSRSGPNLQLSQTDWIELVPDEPIEYSNAVVPRRSA